MTDATHELDLLVIGAGPAGIATAVEARQAGIEKILLVEKGPTHSFSIEKLYTPGKRVDKVYQGQDVACEGSVCIVDGTRESVLETLDRFVHEFNLPIAFETEVTGIRQQEDGFFLVEDNHGQRYLARTVVIAIGVYGRPNKPDFPVPTTLKGHVHFDLTQEIPPGESVLVVGGGNTALEYVAFLYANHPTTLAYRGAHFGRANDINRRILEELQDRQHVTVWTESDLGGVRDTGASPRVEVTFKDGRIASFDHVLFAIGGSTPQGFLQQAGVELDGKSPLVDHRFHTNVPGLFLAGDLVAGGKGSIVKAFNTGHTVVWEGLCADHLECRIPGLQEP